MRLQFGNLQELKGRLLCGLSYFEKCPIMFKSINIVLFNNNDAWKQADRREEEIKKILFKNITSGFLQAREEVSLVVLKPNFSGFPLHFSTFYKELRILSIEQNKCQLFGERMGNGFKFMWWRTSNLQWMEHFPYCSWETNMNVTRNSAQLKKAFLYSFTSCNYLLQTKYVEDCTFTCPMIASDSFHGTKI